jgi:hypothetical protein
MTFLEDVRTELQAAGIAKAVGCRDTPAIFDWLLTAFSYQGVSDQVARTYMEQNGRATWSSLVRAFETEPTCPRLRSYWHYEGCRYDKGSFSCANPEQIADCLVPRPRLRNGRLNQTAASFFLFVRDITKGDLVGWIDHQLRSSPKADRQQALIGPLRNVYGVSDKILTMTLSDLLLGASINGSVWLETGTGMIAIDTLVHNFLYRTGILQSCGKAHQYGVGCYAEGGCADIIKNLSKLIDARSFNRQFPADFPRFVQHAIWRFCAANGLDLCNGNRIDDRKPCQTSYCQLFGICGRKQLKN